jgi:hypothetical protein
LCFKAFSNFFNTLSYRLNYFDARSIMINLSFTTAYFFFLSCGTVTVVFPVELLPQASVQVTVIV